MEEEMLNEDELCLRVTPKWCLKIFFIQSHNARGMA